MCKLFVNADPELWVSKTHSLRIDGMVTSVRMENNSEFGTFLTPGAGLDAGILYHRGDWQWQLGSVGHYFTNDEYRSSSQFAVQWAMTRQHGLRASLERENRRGGYDDEFKLQWRWYYD